MDDATLAKWLREDLPYHTTAARLPLTIEMVGIITALVALLREAELFVPDKCTCGHICPTKEEWFNGETCVHAEPCATMTKARLRAVLGAQP